MAPPQSSTAKPGSGSTNRGFATLDPERQGAPPRAKPVPPRDASPRAQPPAPPLRRRTHPEEAEPAPEPR